MIPIRTGSHSRDVISNLTRMAQICSYRYATDLFLIAGSTSYGHGSNDHRRAVLAAARLCQRCCRRFRSRREGWRWLPCLRGCSEAQGGRGRDRGARIWLLLLVGQALASSGARFWCALRQTRDAVRCAQAWRTSEYPEERKGWSGTTRRGRRSCAELRLLPEVDGDNALG